MTEDVCQGRAGAVRLAVQWLAAASLLAAVPVSETGEEGVFVGAERCKLCHRAAYFAWEKTPHARAVPDLPPSGAERCLECHATDGRRLERVQCESCHGPGADYWPAEVMIDPDKSRMAGLVTPNEAVCRRCHGSEEPGHARTFRMPPRDERRRWVH